MLRDVWSVVAQFAGVRAVLATVEMGVFPIDVPPQDMWLQQGADLGARIASIFDQALASAPAALALGADSPLLSQHHLQLALTALRTHDAVLGPCADGGFYLLGVHRCPPGLLANIPWSSPETASATLHRLREYNFSTCELPPLFDVDTFADIATLEAALASEPLAAPATRLVLAHAH
jgi:hypothetical protein